MKSLFVGNMSFQTTEGELRDLFTPFGQVTRVHMAMDRETGRARGFAFVEMPNDEEAAKAMAGLDGKEVGGRNLKVNEARPKGEGGPPRGPRNFGGPGGGGGGRGKGGGGGRERFSNEDYRESARQPREPRW
jgi:cold-inducible RNA-binding protein